MKKGCFSGFLFLVLIAAILSMSQGLFGGGNSTKTTSQSNNSTQTKKPPITYEYENSVVTETPIQEVFPDYSDAQPVYAGELMRKPTKYNGQRVQLYVAELSVNHEKDHLEIRSDESSMPTINAYVPKSQLDAYKKKSYLIVGGVVNYDAMTDKLSLTDGVIIDTLSTNNAIYISLKNAYDAVIRSEKKKAQDQLIASAIYVPYNDLLKYPSKYKEKVVYFTLKIGEIPLKFTDVILGRGIVCTVSGTDDTVVIYDDRDVKEPTLTEGDVVTVIGISDGLTVVKEQVQGLIRKRTVDRYEVPAIKVLKVQ